MKHFIFIILILSLGVQGSIAGYRLCFKSSRLKVATFTAPTPKPQTDPVAPAGNLQQCGSTFVAILQPPQTRPAYIELSLQKIASHRQAFLSQYMINPPYTPPRQKFI